MLLICEMTNSSFFATTSHYTRMTITRIYSFDPAEINMGFVCAEISHGPDVFAALKGARQNLAEARTTQNYPAIIAALVTLRAALLSIITIRAARNICIAEYDECGARIAAQQGDQAVRRATKLKHAMREIERDLGAPDVVLIEFQMATNSATVSISHQLMYEYGDRTSLLYLSPKLKNTFNLDPSNTYEQICHSYMTGRLANKAHSRANLAMFLKCWPVADDVRGQIPKGAAASDVADAFAQVLCAVRGMLGRAKK